MMKYVHITKRKIRCTLLLLLVLVLFDQCGKEPSGGIIMTVAGPLPASRLGISLTHEHVLVDFIGADSVNESRWNREEVIKTAFPFIRQIQEYGCNSFFECTPSYLGKDPLVLKALSDSTGMNFITNTGYYGAGENNKFIPRHGFTESADQLSQRWIKEWQEGIDGTGIKPGFIKIAVIGNPLTETDIKLVRAAAKTHLATGLTIASHTGPAVLAFEEIEILKSEGVSPEAFVWVHAGNERDIDRLVEGAGVGAWISLDNINENNTNDLAFKVIELKDRGVLGKVLLSHDAGWYDPAFENGGQFRGYTTIFEKLIPQLRQAGFTDEDIEILLIENPAKAFGIRIRSF